MKTDAPERLYLSKNIYSTFLYQVPDPDDETAVEYTRTDSFIDKACKWLKFNYAEFTDNTRCGIKIDELIKDFKQAMEDKE